jgi:nucleoside-diphosphate-sugar epimerase
MIPVSQVLVTGGAGYVGSVLGPKLLAANYRVKVLDLYLYGDHVLDSVREDPRLQQIKGDIRDRALLKQSMAGCDAVIHLACVSNDPSFELDPELGKSINFDAFAPLVETARDSGVRRFIYASTSSVYGIKEEDNVSEDLPLRPLTDYSKFKALCEDELQKYQQPSFTTVTIRSATVCGYSPRLRLDLTVNILTNHAVNRGVITVFGGEQKRPNIHIEDITDLYVDLLSRPDSQVAGKIWNAGYENHRVREIADMVCKIVGPERVKIVTSPTDDHRSYHISSERIRRDLGFVARRSLEHAIHDLTVAFRTGKVPGAMDDIRYYNVKTMQVAQLK